MGREGSRADEGSEERQDKEEIAYCIHRRSVAISGTTDHIIGGRDAPWRVPTNRMRMDNDKYKGRFRNETTRLRTWDYAADAWYFVTICTHNRTHYFGEIANDAMRLSLIGKMAQKYWEEIRSHFVGIDLDEYVIMPNHMHGIIVINKQDTTSTVGMRHGASLQPATGSTPDETANIFGPLKKNSLQSIINQYKGTVTRWCKKNGHTEFAWQSRYYEHVIRNQETLNKIRVYIANNPSKWALDKENAAGTWI